MNAQAFHARIKRFFINKKGSVTIEFIFMLMFLTFVFAFLADLVILRSTMGKLDNASYALVNVLRERTQLYDREYKITAEDHKQYEQLAKKLLYGNSDSTKPVGLVMEYWSKDDQITLPSSTPQCEPYRALSSVSYLSPNSEINNQRKIPLYQVTLCVETHSFFKAILLDKSSHSLGWLRSSSMSVAR
ncbi:tight adherence pilus pseudopilin TadF [Pasteurella sp. PK-2025]|uniref:tight adherence pilus pseudopilin TadF n=1 Tax=Pasteurella sp. PK-2025 TaxID=3413133 RepID=UPI003C779362